MLSNDAMKFLPWRKAPKAPKTREERDVKSPATKSRAGKTVVFDVTQHGNSIAVEGGDVAVHFTVEGIDLPPDADASFAVWGILAAAMEEGFNVHINRPIDPLVAANAERLTQIWEMWVPSQYRSITVSGEGAWSRPPRERWPRLELYSGGCDSTYAILQRRDRGERGYVATIYGLDYRSDKGESGAFDKLLTMTDPLLETLNCKRIVIRTDANRRPQKFTHGFTLAGCLFLLSDLFAEGTLAADLTPAQDALPFPWGTNHITNPYLAGSDFAVRTVGDEIGRTGKLAAIAESGCLPFLACCRRSASIPVNCGVCSKCVRTKVMLFAATGSVPDIFRDATFDERLMMQNFNLKSRFERAELFDLYHYAKDRGIADTVPGLERLIEQCRRMPLTGKSKKPKREDEDDEMPD
jgi:hypothetical protein